MNYYEMKNINKQRTEGKTSDGTDNLSKGNHPADHL